MLVLLLLLRKASAATAGLAFRGRAVVEAVFDSLRRTHGLGQPATPGAASGQPGERPAGERGAQKSTEERVAQKGTEEHVVLYAGCSAGGRGVLHNLNRVAAQLAAMRSHSGLQPIRLFGLIDSGTAP